MQIQIQSQIIKQHLTQSLKLTPYMRQSLRILQSPILEVKRIVEEEMICNPLLEENTDVTEYVAEENERDCYPEQIATEPPSLQEYLLHQLRLFVTRQEDLNIGEIIIGNINENGYLCTSVEEIAQECSVEQVDRIEEVLKIIQGFDPCGIGARNLRESLLIQLKSQGKKDILVWKLVYYYLDMLGKKEYLKLSRLAGIDVKQIKEAVGHIKRLNPKPGKTFGNYKPSYILPEAIIRHNGDRFDIEMNERWLPRISISSIYPKMTDKICEPSAVYFLKDSLMAAKNLIRSVSMRQHTLRKVIQCIIKIQKEAIISNDFGLLKPLTMGEIAEKLGLHESTISRTIANKYIELNNKILSFSSLLPKRIKSNRQKAISSSRIEYEIEELIKNENKSSPLTDKDIVNILISKGVTVPRRTVTKYRLRLKLLPAHLRKEL